MSLLHHSSAAWGFLGVVVGSLLATAKDFLVEGKRASRDRETDLRREKGEARVACRLIGDELDTLAGNLKLLHGLGRTLERPIDENALFLGSSEWQEHKGTLARILDNDDTWNGLTAVYHNVRSLRTRAIL